MQLVRALCLPVFQGFRTQHTNVTHENPAGFIGIIGLLRGEHGGNTHEHHQRKHQHSWVRVT